jgi:hypothetical protein
LQILMAILRTTTFYYIFYLPKNLVIDAVTNNNLSQNLMFLKRNHLTATTFNYTFFIHSNFCILFLVTKIWAATVLGSEWRRILQLFESIEQSAELLVDTKGFVPLRCVSFLFSSLVFRRSTYLCFLWPVVRRKLTLMAPDVPLKSTAGVACDFYSTSFCISFSPLLFSLICLCFYSGGRRFRAFSPSLPRCCEDIRGEEAVSQWMLLALNSLLC